jgi:hypothetical protein
MSFYYWLVPLLVLAIIAIAMFASSARRKSKSTVPSEGEATEAIKRGRYMNK